VKYVLNLNHLEIPRRHHCTNLASVKMKFLLNINTSLWSTGVHVTVYIKSWWWILLRYSPRNTDLWWYGIVGSNVGRKLHYAI